MVYLVTVGLLCLLSLVLNAIVLNLNDRDVNFQKDMPKWVKMWSDFFFEYVVNFLLFNFENLIKKLGPI